jgi:hypothetical protein
MVEAFKTRLQELQKQEQTRKNKLYEKEEQRKTEGNEGNKRDGEEDER